MIKILKIAIAVCLSAVILWGCEKPDEYPEVPSIEYKSLSTMNDGAGYVQKILVTLNFTDGDGDVGYHPPAEHRNDPIFDDPFSPYYNNFIVTTYYTRNGISHVDTVSGNGRIPYLTQEGKNLALKGEIVRDLPVIGLLNNDTVYYDIFIYDRKLNRSNTIRTDKMVIRTY